VIYGTTIAIPYVNHFNLCRKELNYLTVRLKHRELLRCIDHYKNTRRVRKIAKKCGAL
jgi:hypothetical protein